jgi:hypothetical protein
MDEGRKRVLLIAASILAARKLAQLDGLRRSPAFESIIADAITTAERIMQRIEAKYPDQREQHQNSYRDGAR